MNGNLTVTGSTDAGKTSYSTPSPIEMMALTAEDTAKLEAGDAITDRFGKGRTVYVNRCADCGKVLLTPAIILVPIFCSECAMKREEEAERERQG